MENFQIILYGCLKAERRWLSSLVQAHNQLIPVPVGNGQIIKPALRCGELSQLVVSGSMTGLILTPFGLHVRFLKPNPLNDKELPLDEVEKLDQFLSDLKMKNEFMDCEMVYSAYMARVLTLTIGDQFDLENFKKNVG